MTGLSDHLTEGVGHLADARAAIFRASDVLGRVSAAFDDELKGLFDNTDELLGRVERLRSRLEEARL